MTQEILKPDTIINNTPVSQLEKINLNEDDSGLITVRSPNRIIAALFVLDDGPYFGIPNVDAWVLNEMQESILGHTQ